MPRVMLRHHDIAAHIFGPAKIVRIALPKLDMVKPDRLEIVIVTDLRPAPNSGRAFAFHEPVFMSSLQVLSFGSPMVHPVPPMNVDGL